MTTTTSATTAPATAGPATADARAAAQVPARIVAAWAHHDADAFAEVFTEDGTMIMPGVHLTGRDAIRSYMTSGFTGRYQGTRVTGQPVRVAVLAPEAAVLVTRGGVLLPGESEVAPERLIHASWVLVKRDGSWRLAVYQNSPA
ncbi:SgcJ/EcaC family oxidoreductase [Actinomycetes bacterium KLBMP 9797]